MKTDGYHSLGRLVGTPAGLCTSLPPCAAIPADLVPKPDSLRFPVPIGPGEIHHPGFGTHGGSAQYQNAVRRDPPQSRS
jgi:hypothetical protein